jgi:hypothetical protein
VRQILAISNFLALLELRLLLGTIGHRDEMILSIHLSHRPSVHLWSDGPIKLAPLKEEKML